MPNLACCKHRPLGEPAGDRAGAPDGSQQKRPIWLLAAELTLLLVTAAMLGSLGVCVGTATAELGTLWPLAVGLVLGVLAADFLSGVVHWFCDRFFAEDTPIVGRVLIGPFRAHHMDPEGIVRHGLLELHGNSCMPVIASLAAARWTLPEPAHAGPLVLHAGLLVFALAALATNQFHRWAHDDRAPRFARWLQETGVILSAERHARHHRGSFDQSYCMTTGWLNPLLDRLGWFPSLEAGIRKLQRSCR
jgi:ubiquitin-conjugating enzyme E2 variant